MHNNPLEVSRGAAARGVTVKLVVCSIPTRGGEILTYNLYFHSFALMLRLSAALSSATQHEMLPELECCLRNTA